MGEGSVEAGGVSWSSRLGGRTIRATSAILALRRKIELKAVLDGALGGMTLGAVTAVAGTGACFRMKGESFSSGFGVEVVAAGAGKGCVTGAGSLFLASG